MICTAGSDRISRTVSTARILSQVSAAKKVNTEMFAHNGPSACAVFDQYLFGRTNVASGEKIVKPLDLLSVFVPRIDQGNPVKRVGENRAHSSLLGTP